MTRLIRHLKTLSTILYWIGMVCAGIAAIVFVGHWDNQLAYALALLAVVAMMTSSIMLYARNLISVGEEISSSPEKEGEEKKEVAKATAEDP